MSIKLDYIPDTYPELVFRNGFEVGKLVSFALDILLLGIVAHCSLRCKDIPLNQNPLSEAKFIWLVILNEGEMEGQGPCSK